MTSNPYPVAYHPTFEILDSSKISEYMECPRKFFFRYVMGWSPTKPSLHLEFGSAWHKAMEYLNINGRSSKNVISAWELATEYLRENYPDYGEVQKGKTCSNMFSALRHYVKVYSADNHIRLHTEVAGTVPISDKRVLHFRTDYIYQAEMDLKHPAIYSIDYKTGSRLSPQWLNQWANSFQMNTYYHAMCAYYGYDKFKGMIVDGTHFTGELEKETPDFSKIFVRVPIKKTEVQLKLWLYEANYWVDRIEDSMTTLKTASPHDDALYCFPRVGGSCTKYAGCPYLNYCQLVPNPLKNVDMIPEGMTIRRWDPSDYEDKKHKPSSIINV